MGGRWDVVDPLLNRLLRRCLELVPVSGVEVREGEVFIVMAERREDAGEDAEEDAVFGALMGREEGYRGSKGYSKGYSLEDGGEEPNKTLSGRKGAADGRKEDLQSGVNRTKDSANNNTNNNAKDISHHSTNTATSNTTNTAKDQPISNYLPFALQRIRLASRLWKLPLNERKRRVADCLEIPLETMNASRELLFQKCVLALAKRILSEVIEEEVRGSVWLYMAIAKNVVEGRTRPVKVQFSSIDVKVRKHLFLTYEAISMAIRLAFSPFSILHLDVNDMFIKVGLGLGCDGKRVEFRRFLEEYYRLSCSYGCLFQSIPHGVCLFRFGSEV